MSLFCELGLVHRNPAFNDDLQLTSPPDNLVGVRVRRDKRAVVVDLVALAAGNVEVSPQTSCTGTEDERQSLERSFVMPARFGIESIAGARDCHFSE
jgi:hypothetical protein